MRLLLDTHAFLWFVNDSPELTEPVRELLEDAANDLYLSIASAWEIAIKTSLGKLQLPESLSVFIPTHVQANDLVLMSIEIRHLGLVAALPFHHKDPFDRLLAAQSLIEVVPIVSIDAKLDAYGVNRIWPS